MSNETLGVGQLICNSTTPPPDRGFFKVDDTTTGHVGDLKVFDPVTNQPSTVITATPSGGVLEASAGGLVFSNAAKPQIVGNGGMPNNTWGNGAGGRTDVMGDSRRLVNVGSSDVSQLQVAFAGFYVASGGGLGEADLANDYVATAALELVTPSTYQPAFFGNEASVNVAAGAPLVLSTPIGYALPAGTQLYVRTGASVDASTKVFPRRSSTTASSGQIGPSGTVSQVKGTGAITGSGGAMGYSAGVCQYALIGVPKTPMVSAVLLGDSIWEGAGDSTGDAYGWMGYGARGMNLVPTPIPFVLQSSGGDFLSKNQSTNGIKKRSMWPYATDLFCELGTNDIATGASLATLQGYCLAIWGAAKRTIGPYGRALRVHQMAILPRTTSTDSWATAANQTPATGFGVGGVRDQLNAWFLEKVADGTIDSVIDCCSAVEDPANHAKWITNGTANYPTSDGVHPSQVMHIAMAQLLAVEAAKIVP